MSEMREIAESRLKIEDYCREIETYLCQKNDGHLIRVVGPSFEIVSSWATRGVPIKIAFEGIDRYFERYYRSGPRRRPVKIDFCEDDVLDVFDEWRRATGVQSAGVQTKPPASPSLPEHLERVVTRLTAARASGRLSADFDRLIDRASADLDVARAAAGGVRGEARAVLLARLTDLDVDLLAAAREQLDAEALAAMAREAEDELAPFRPGMRPDAYARARAAVIDRLVRARCGLPVAIFQSAT